MYRIRLMRISVVSFPRSTSLMKWASTCICTISSAPRSTPHKMLEYHSSSWARPSSGSSTKSANGFSSKTSENCLPSLVQFVIVGVMLRNILKPTCDPSDGQQPARVHLVLPSPRTLAIISAVSRKLEHRLTVFDLAR